ncbi:sodium:calcium antiporter [Ornatilinea apprima]|uniref:sodium:calcium antiporter n=1 Tax=Ornatilinea apprima TaxID=1134406 RepID=UPI001364B16E|nr:sodium:calcium antiporter [Ornatilinea apprima]
MEQNIWVVSFLGLGALVLLVVTANVAVKKLIGIASFFHLSSTFMGMTVVSLATSIPEITAHLTASTNILRGTLDYEVGSAIVLGANIGSDVVQQTFILGLVVFIAGGLTFRRYFLWKSMIPMILTNVLCIFLALNGNFSRLDGIILLISFMVYNYFLYMDERKFYRKEDNLHQDEEIANSVPRNLKEVLIDTLVALGMIIITIFSATYVLNITEMIVNRTGIGGSLIGVVTLGVASALPELTTALAGIGKKEHGISLGTLIGSNITNPLVAIGGGALLSTYAAPRPLILWDLPAATFTGAVLWAVIWFSKGKLSKWGATYLLVLYFIYILIRALFFAVD